MSIVSKPDRLTDIRRVLPLLSNRERTVLVGDICRLASLARFLTDHIRALIINHKECKND